MKFIYNLIKASLVVVPLSVCFLCIASCACAGYIIYSSRPLSDSKLLDYFSQHRNEFNQLSQMLVDEEEIIYIEPSRGKCLVDGPKMISSLENPKCGEYVRLLKSLGLGIAHSGEYILLPYPPGDTIKGFCYSTGLPGDIVSDTDKNIPDDDIVYRYIEGNWYIFRDTRN